MQISKIGQPCNKCKKPLDHNYKWGRICKSCRNIAFKRQRYAKHEERLKKARIWYHKDANKKKNNQIIMDFFQQDRPYTGLFHYCIGHTNTLEEARIMLTDYSRKIRNDQSIGELDDHPTIQKLKRCYRRQKTLE